MQYNIGSCTSINHAAKSANGSSMCINYFVDSSIHENLFDLSMLLVIDDIANISISYQNYIIYPLFYAVLLVVSTNVISARLLYLNNKRTHETPTRVNNSKEPCEFVKINQC